MSAFDNVWFVYGVPIGALAFALVTYLWAWHSGRQLDRRFERSRPGPAE